MVIMSVDYGDVRTGIAFCDKNEMLASPYTVLQESYQPKLVDKLLVIIEEKKPETVVIGLPRNMDGTYGYRCDACRSLGDALQEKLTIPVVYEDERLTTVMAHGALSSNNVRGKKRKDVVDAVSAVMILQSYIDRRKKQGNN